MSTVLVVVTLVVAGLAIATVWLREGDAVGRRIARLAVVALTTAVLCVAFNRVRVSWDVSENRRNSFPAADEAALRAIDKPLSVTVYLAAEDPRLVDLERGVLSKLLLGMFFVTFLVLMWLGLKPAEGLYVMLARIFTALYFAFFILLPFVSKADGNGPVPERVTYHAH